MRTDRGTILLEQGITGGTLRYSPPTRDHPGFNHYKCTPTSISPSQIMFGANRAEILVQMRRRAAQYNGSVNDALIHDYRVNSAATASFFFLWATSALRKTFVKFSSWY